MLLVILLLIGLCCVILSIAGGFSGWWFFIREEPVDGGWSDWVYGDCTKECDGGKKSKTRTCDNPPPSGGGKECVGKSEDTPVACNTITCEELEQQEETAKQAKLDAEKAAAAKKTQDLNNARRKLFMNQDLTNYELQLIEEDKQLAGCIGTSTEILLCQLQKQTKDAKKEYDNAENGDSTISKSEAGALYALTLGQYIDALTTNESILTEKQKEDLDKYTDEDTKFAHYLDYTPTTISGPKVENKIIKPFVCNGKDKFVTGIVGNQYNWLNQIGVECSDGSDSKSDLTKKSKDCDKCTNTWEVYHPFNSDFKLTKSSGFDKIDVHYSDAGIFGIDVYENQTTKHRFGNQDSKSTLEDLGVETKTLGCYEGRIKGIKASVGGGSHGIVNQIGLVCDSSGKPLSDAATKTSKTLDEMKIERSKVQSSEEALPIYGDSTVLRSPNGVYELKCQVNLDGNLFIVKNGTEVTWATNKYDSNKAPYELKLQSYGNLVVVKKGHENHDPLTGKGYYWLSDLKADQDNGPYTLQLKNDGNLYITDKNGTPRWDKNSYQQEIDNQAASTNQQQAAAAAREAQRVSTANCIQHGDRVMLINKDISTGITTYYLTRSNYHETKWKKTDYIDGNLNHHVWTIKHQDGTTGCIDHSKKIVFSSDSSAERLLEIGKDESGTEVFAHKNSSNYVNMSQLKQPQTKYLKNNDTILLYNIRYLSSTTPGTDSKGYGTTFANVRNTSKNQNITIVKA